MPLRDEERTARLNPGVYVDEATIPVGVNYFERDRSADSYYNWTTTPRGSHIDRPWLDMAFRDLWRGSNNRDVLYASILSMVAGVMFPIVMRQTSIPSNDYGSMFGAYRGALLAGCDLSIRESASVFGDETGGAVVGCNYDPSTRRVSIMSDTGRTVDFTIGSIGVIARGIQEEYQRQQHMYTYRSSHNPPWHRGHVVTWAGVPEMYDTKENEETKLQTTGRPSGQLPTNFKGRKRPKLKGGRTWL